MLNKKLGAVALALLAASCGGGGGGGGGGEPGVLLSSSGTVAVEDVPGDNFKFDAKLGQAYAVTVTPKTGDPDLMLSSDDLLDPLAYSYPFAYSYNEPPDLDIISFVSNLEAPFYAYVYTEVSGTSDYQIKVTSNHLTVDAAPRAGELSNYDSVYYSFDATAGSVYRVTVTPVEGDADLYVYSDSYDCGETRCLTGSVGSSAAYGMDDVIFQASSTGIHYIRVDEGTYAKASYTVQVEEIGTGPDLSVSINEIDAGMTTMNINYTVRNRSLTAAGAFNLHFVSNSASKPALTTLGAGDPVAVPALGADSSMTGNVTIPLSTVNGTAYGIVDPERAVTEGNENDNVSPGMPWTAPIEAMGTTGNGTTFDFEDNRVPSAFARTGDGLWATNSQTNPSANSRYSFKAGAIDDNESSCFGVSVGVVGTLSFQWKVESEAGDYVRFYVNGSQVRSATGVVDWSTVTYSVYDIGVRNYMWCYEKNDDGAAYGRDTAWVDNIQFTVAKPDLSVALTSATSDGATLTLGYTVNNAGGPVPATTPIQLRLWPDLASPPAVSTAGGTVVPISGLSYGSSVSGTYQIPYTNTIGTAYAAVDSPNSITESDENDNVSAGRSWTYRPNLRVSITGVSYNPDSTINVNYTVTNTGTAPSPDASLQVWSNLSSAPLVSSIGGTVFTVPGIAIGGSYAGSATVPYTGIQGTAWAAIDSPSNAIAETVETDNVSTGQAWAYAPELRVMINSVSSDGNNVTVGFTVSNAGTVDSTVANLQVWPNLTSAPTVASTGGTTFVIPGITAGSTYTGTETVAYVGTTGTAWVAIDSPNAITESNESNNVSLGVNWVTGTPTVVYSFESGTMDGFTMSGNLGWGTTTATASAGTYSAVNGNIGDSQQSCMSVSAASASNIAFDWKVSSESGYDYLRFYVDDVLQSGSISGTVAWTQKTSSLIAGAHTFKWCYTKDGSVSSGSDSGWVDNIRIY